MTIHDVRAGLSFSGKNVLFDTNVWININGFDVRPGIRDYSAYYSELLRSDNTIVISDIVLGEFFNACLRIEYNIRRKEAPIQGLNFKQFRDHEDTFYYKDCLKDTCLNMLEDCSFAQLATDDVALATVVEESCSTKLDFNDISIRNLCLEREFVLVTDDIDFKGSGLEIATANTKYFK